MTTVLAATCQTNVNDWILVKLDKTNLIFFLATEGWKPDSLMQESENINEYTTYAIYHGADCKGFPSNLIPVTKFQK